MKSIIFIQLFLFVGIFGFAQSSKTTKAPDIYFQDVAADFGTAKEGTRPQVTFTFFNSGSAPLLLKDVKPSCGCTVPDYPKQPIMPGQSGEISVEFNTAGYGNQKVHKSISVITNVPENGTDKVVIIFVKGRVTK